MVSASLLAAFICGGCANDKQVQYFEVVGDPDAVTGIAPRSYYRMTLEGRGALLAQYKLRAAYVSAATLDTLNGKLPVIPEADLPPENQQVFNTIKQTYLSALNSRATSLAATQPSNGGDVIDGSGWEARMVEIARSAWFASLNDPDLISLGEVRSSNPFQFRKLVFYASATDANLQDYDTQINSVVDKASVLSRYFTTKADNKTNQGKPGGGSATPKGMPTIKASTDQNGTAAASLPELIPAPPAPPAAGGPATQPASGRPDTPDATATTAPAATSSPGTTQP